MRKEYPTDRKKQLSSGPIFNVKRETKPLFDSEKVILSLFDYSGNWSEPYREAGYKVVQIDKDLNGQDVRLYNHEGPVYGVLAAPPCTVFSKASGSRQRTETEMLEAVGCMDAVMRIVYKAKPAFWAVENPQGRMKQWLGEPVLKFQPFHYGDPYSKYSYLWGSFNAPEVQQLEPVESDRTTNSGWGMRSRSNTPKGFSRKFFEANR